MERTPHWNDLIPASRTQLTEWMRDNNTSGPRLTVLATTDGRLDLDFLVWLHAIDRGCVNRTGQSLPDIAVPAHYPWRAEFDRGVRMAVALTTALLAAGHPDA